MWGRRIGSPPFSSTFSMSAPLSKQIFRSSTSPRVEVRVRVEEKVRDSDRVGDMVRVKVSSEPG
jgi:hypothetical protein